MKPEDLARADGRLTAFLDVILARSIELAGSHLACRPGCADCCIGPFPITALDAVRLRGGIEELASRDPGRAAALLHRAREAAARLSADFPGDSESGLLWPGEAAREAFFVRHERLPCPALGPDGLCELYAFRPVSCRTFGPPVRIEGVPLPPCRLCFTKAAPRQIETCRVDIDCGEIEEPLLDRAEAETGLSGETLVAFALGRPQDPGLTA